MKSTKELLRESFSSIPNNFAYREVRFYVYQALQRLESLEKKTNIKNKQQEADRLKEEAEREEIKKRNGGIYIKGNPYSVRETLNVIDEMIADEKSKIGNHLKKGPINEPTDDRDDDDIQTFHG